MHLLPAERSNHHAIDGALIGQAIAALDPAAAPDRAAALDRAGALDRAAAPDPAAALDRAGRFAALAGR